MTAALAIWCFENEENVLYNGMVVKLGSRPNIHGLCHCHQVPQSQPKLLHHKKEIAEQKPLFAGYASCRQLQEL